MIEVLILALILDGGLGLLVAMPMITDWVDDLPTRAHRRACVAHRALRESQGVHTSFAGWSGAHTPIESASTSRYSSGS